MLGSKPLRLLVLLALLSHARRLLSCKLGCLLRSSLLPARRLGHLLLPQRLSLCLPRLLRGLAGSTLLRLLATSLLLRSGGRGRCNRSSLLLLPQLGSKPIGLCGGSLRGRLVRGRRGCLPKKARVVLHTLLCQNHSSCLGLTHF